MGRSILTRAVNGDPTNLSCACTTSRSPAEGGKFINVSCVVADDGVEGLPFGGPARAGVGKRPLPGERRVLRLRAARGSVGIGSRWRFWCGREARSRRAVWSENESDAVALFAPPADRRALGDVERALGVWLLLYNAGSPRGINARVASHPWGPWSDPVVVFDPGGRAPGTASSCTLLRMRRTACPTRDVRTNGEASTGRT